MTASLEPTQSIARTGRRAKSPRSRFVVPALCILLMTFCAITSRGFTEPDEITHFLYARSVWGDWTLLFSIWGRLGCTGFYMWVAPLGVIPARLAASGVTALVALGTTSLLKQLVPGVGRGATWARRHGVALVWLLLFAQPCFAMDSFLVMTEMLLACSWVWAAVTLAHSRQRPWGGVLLASALVGIGGVMRPEGWIAIACWPAFVFLWIATQCPAARPRRGSLALLGTLIAGLPVLSWYLTGYFGKNDRLWFVHQWPWSPHSVYGRTTEFFLIGALGSMGLWMWGPIVLATRRVVGTGGGWPRRRRAALFLLVFPLAGVYLLHGLLGSFGLFGSMSLPRYFIIVAPMGAILALMGLIAIERQLRTARGKLLLKAAVIALPLLLSLLPLVALHILPAQPGKTQRELDAIAVEIESRVPPGDYAQRLILGHPYIILRLGLPIGLTADRRIYDPATLANAAPGTILVIEPRLWASEARPSAQQLIAWGWHEDAAATTRVMALPAKWDIFSIADDPSWHASMWIKQ